MEWSGIGIVHGINKCVFYSLYYESQKPPEVCYQVTVLGIRLEKEFFFPTYGDLWNTLKTL